MARSSQRRRSRAGGFVLVTAMLVMMVIVGVSAMLLVGAQAELAKSAHERAQALAFYAAEYAVAETRATLAASDGSAPLESPALEPRVCAPVGTAPGTQPRDESSTTTLIVGAAAASYQWCLHAPLRAVEPSVRRPLVVEAWGQAGDGAHPALAHLTVTLGERQGGGLDVVDWIEN